MFVMDFQIAESKSSDLIEISRIWIEVIDFHAKFDKSFTLVKEGSLNFQLMITAALTDPNQVVYVAKKGKEIVGFLYGFIKKYSGMFKPRLTAHVSDITIKKEYRRKNIGTALMHKFEEEFAKSRKADEISLNVHSQNVEGLNFYNKLGFSKKLITLQKSLRND
ncbi:MAG: GNAT family N-acetyltransferase [Candidatus Heimdallarchaeota archaeon]|nr:GNAT family N-acetyltransferase [Candidatus Heimdallarchaeota archaeon]MCK4253639.1 GNAT family N-acetyltransferase [Candidatus Heimdallarchaeota archaeon]